MKTNELYEKWLQNATEDADLIAELNSVKGNEEEIYDRFYRNLEFGTAGLRGVIGAGTNRMNIYNVRLATQGLANYLNKKYENSAVAISFDSRIKADVFAKESAKVLAGNGIKVYISKELQPTPVLSYLVREFNCKSGIMVTASHNPAAYNGYKCYGSDGCQLTDDSANAVYDEIQSVDCFTGVKLLAFEDGLSNGLIEYVDDSVYESYLENVEKQTVNKDICKGADLKVVFTPLNGAGNKLVRKIMDRIGVEDVHIVAEQENPDGNFTTCPYPNPEMKEALALGLDLCNKVKPDLLLATDPDSDRVGIAAIDGDNYRLISGNETGIMLTNYILSCRTEQNNLPKNPIVVKTVVTSILVNQICNEFNCELRNVLTGFKYIGEQILELEQNNEENRFIFGFEESYGYLCGTYVRDKDAVVASMLICEMASFYKKQGKTLCNVIDELYAKYGYYKNTTLNFGFEGASGMDKMQEIMTSLRNNTPSAISGFKVEKVDDYQLSVSKNIKDGTEQEIFLPKSNVIAYTLENNNAVIVRPSGTEPKIKLYLTAVGTSNENADEITSSLAKDGEKLLSI